MKKEREYKILLKRRKKKKRLGERNNIRISIRVLKKNRKRGRG
jgi:hypothetical protein